MTGKSAGNDWRDYSDLVRILEEVRARSNFLRGNAFVQNGNSFGTSAVLGTNDAQKLFIETQNIARMAFDLAGNVQLRPQDVDPLLWSSPAKGLFNDGAAHTLYTFDVSAFGDAIAFDFVATVIGMNTGATGGTKGDTYKADIRGTYKKVSGVGALALVGPTPIPANVAADTGAQNWIPALTIAAGNQAVGLNVTATGGGVTVRWASVVEILDVFVQ